jgi:hypothetical protein
MVDTLALPNRIPLPDRRVPVPGAWGAASAPTVLQMSLTEGIGSSLEGRIYYALERKFHHVPTAVGGIPSARPNG